MRRPSEPRPPERAGEHLRNALQILHGAITGARPGLDGELVVPMHLVAAVQRRIEAALDLVEDVRRLAAGAGAQVTQETARRLL